MADIRSVKNSTSGASDEYVEAIRQKIGTGFSDQKATGKKRNELGKDDFIKLMSAQLKHQDPMSPLKNEQMAAQLAQFSSLEQMVNVNSNLEKMSAAQKPQENVLAASLIGKKIMTDSSKFMLNKGAQPEVKFDLPADAQSVSVSLVDAKGEIVREYELGTMAKGEQMIRWDGKNGKSQEVTPGEYTYRINAVDHENKPLQIATASGGLVSGVSFEGGKALLLVDGKKIPMDAVARIEADFSNASAKPLADVKQNSSSQSPGKINDAAVKNSLPPGLDAEKIKSMLGSLGSSSRMEVESEVGPAGAEGENAPMPLWNPNL